MLKAKIQKEITITNEEIAQMILEDESIFDTINNILNDILYSKYMDFDSRCDIINQLTTVDYVEILRILTSKILKEG